MIFVSMDLASAVSSDRDRNLCRLEICNIDDRGSRADYVVRLYAKNDGQLIREAFVRDYAKLRHPAWRLLAEAMKALEKVK